MTKPQSHHCELFVINKEPQAEEGDRDAEDCRHSDAYLPNLVGILSNSEVCPGSLVPHESRLTLLLALKAPVDGGPIPALEYAAFEFPHLRSSGTVACLLPHVIQHSIVRLQGVQVSVEAAGREPWIIFLFGVLFHFAAMLSDICGVPMLL